MCPQDHIYSAIALSGDEIKSLIDSCFIKVIDKRNKYIKNGGQG
jgi:hypothetical protein